jgi:DNA-binding Lrp family transcriptional regulator
MNPVLKLLIDGGSLTTGQMAKVAGLTEAEVNQHLEQLKKDQIFLGWRPVLDLSREAAAAAAVRAVIEVKITPERGEASTGSPSASRASTRLSRVT